MKKIFTIMMAAMLCGMLSAAAQATQIQDLVRLKGSESNQILGMGLVVGLKGTGDSGKYAPTVRALAQSMQTLIDANTVAGELTSTKNVAIVYIDAEVPANGARDGDKIDVRVSSAGDAKSISGGRLIMVPLIHPAHPGVAFAHANGSVQLEDKDHPTVGIIRQGGKMSRNVWAQFFDEHFRLTLVLDDKIAAWPVAHALTQHINDELSPDDEPDVARAIDQKNIIIAVPAYERNNPANYINRILSLRVNATMINTPARVVINENTGTIVFTGDVRLSPVIISHRGLTITTLTPTPAPEDVVPTEEENQFVVLNPDKEEEAKLADLLSALNQLKVEAPDRIAIIKEIDRSGKLHAKLIIQN